MGIQNIEDYKKELLSIFFAQRKVIFWVTVIIFTCSLLIAFLWPPTYSASGSILVKGKRAEKSTFALEKEEIRSFPLTKEDLASEEQIMTSLDVIERAIKYLQENKLYPETKTISNDDIYKIKNNLKTQIIPASNVINITFYSHDPDEAKVILEALIEQYVFYRMKVYTPVQMEVFLSHQLNNFKDELSAKSNELIALSRKTKLSYPQREIENNLEVKMDLELQLNSLKNDAIERKLYIEYLEKTLSSKDIQYFSTIENLAINGLGALGPKLQELVAEKRMILRTYHPLSEKVQSVEKQINDTYTALKNEVIAYKKNLSNQLQIINEKIKSIEERINSLDTRNVEIRGQQINMSQVNAEVKMLLSSLETFTMRKAEARISSSEESSNPSYVSILSKAFSSEGPVFPKKPIIIPLGFIIGLIAGCSLGFIREYFDHTFKKPSDVESYVGLPVIFSIPK
jgi:uncharacterized protein involved in exopolysaccharide biosynthesis